MLNKFLEDADWVRVCRRTAPDELINAEKVYVKTITGEVVCGKPSVLHWPNISAYARRANGHIDLSGLAPADTVTLGTETDIEFQCALPHMDVPGYESLAAVLSRAYMQSATGKGAERHARENEPFDQQVILQGARRFGHGALLFQAFKKSEESQRLPAPRAVAELLGAIVYLAAAVIAIEETAGAQ